MLITTKITCGHAEKSPITEEVPFLQTACKELRDARGTLEPMPTAYIGMGANLASTAGPPPATLAAAALRLEALGCLTARSSLYSTEPVGFAAQPRFVNAVVALETELDPQGLLTQLLAIERDFGRDRAASFPNGPRTLDLDVLLYGDLVLTAPDLEIPHPRLADRAFVLIPLCQIAPHRVDARSQATVSQLLHDLQHRLRSETDAVVAIQSDSWHAGPGSGGVSSRPA
jgi:2-amino-4-hydroxy-6-hydroxymethyldihydropteridine diphosphokinase